MSKTVGDLISASKATHAALNAASLSLAAAQMAETQAESAVAQADAELAGDLASFGPAVDFSGDAPEIYQAAGDGKTFTVIRARALTAGVPDPAAPAPVPQVDPSVPAPATA